MMWSHCDSCPSVSGCAEADCCERDRLRPKKTVMTFAELMRESPKARRNHALQRWALLAFRAFWRSFWRSLGWCIPIILALEWWARHKP